MADSVSRSAAQRVRWFEDYVVGAIHELGSIQVEAGEVQGFARQFDPQPFHTDPQAASASHFGGLIASGWHTAALMMRLFALNYLSPQSSLGSPGIEELRWPRPVRPGDVLAVRVTITDARISQSRPDRGIIRSLIEVFNQNGELVMSANPANLILRKPQ
ncbi:MAG: MaoC family dehydratase [Betaproteobacteria bacterium]